MAPNGSMRADSGAAPMHLHHAPHRKLGRGKVEGQASFGVGAPLGAASDDPKQDHPGRIRNGSEPAKCKPRKLLDRKVNGGLTPSHRFAAGIRANKNPAVSGGVQDGKLAVR